MNNLYLLILKALLRRANYSNYYHNLPQDFLQKNYPDIYRLYQVLPALHEGGADEYGVNDLEVAFYAGYPKADEGMNGILFAALRNGHVDDKVVTGAIRQMAEREIALKLAKAALQVSEGQGSLMELQAMFAEVPKEEVDPDEDPFVTDDLEVLLDEFYGKPGLRWRLQSLNGALGSLRKGNFGFLFARPETGKTTFLASEVTFMSAGLPPDAGPIVWFNNEQAGGEVKLRMYQAALGRSEAEMKANRQQTYEDYLRVTQGKLKLIDDGGLSRQRVEAIARKYSPSLMIFDQIDKIKGFKADRNDLELKAIYQWARELAKEYGPTIGVCQAGGSGEGKKWLTMDDVDSSKTGKQGEADWILGIGMTAENGAEYLRHLNLSKNKLHGDEDTDPQRRHDKWTVVIKPEIARYVDVHQA